MTIFNSTLYMVDDDIALCDAVKWLFDSIKIDVRIFNNGKEYLAFHNPSLRGCLLIDVRMPVMGGFELLKELKKKDNQMPILILTGHGDVPLAVRAMKEGVFDFILKPFDEEVLLEKVQELIDLDKKRSAKLENSVNKDSVHKMTPREQEIMKLILDGKLSKQIADQLNISLSTIEFHRGNLMRKLKAKNVAELVKVYLNQSSNDN